MDTLLFRRTTLFPYFEYETRQLFCVIAFLVCFVNLFYWLAPHLAIAIAKMVAALNYADHRVMLALNFEGSPMADKFWYGYSQQLTWSPLIVVAIVTAVRMHPGSTKDKVVFVISIAILICLFDQISSGIIKPLVGRLRPSHDPTIEGMLHYVKGYRGGMHGFVSSHAANTVGLATILCSIFRDKMTRATLIVFAALMCYSRIYLGVHFPGDVVCGALLGWGIAFLAIRYLGGRMKMYKTNRRPVLLLVGFVATCVFVML